MRETKSAKTESPKAPIPEMLKSELRDLAVIGLNLGDTGEVMPATDIDNRHLQRTERLDIVSVDEVGSFKPDPAVYNHFLERAGAQASSAWLISSNPFDVIGAVSSGMRAAWVKRSDEALFDPWGIEPTAIVHSLSGLQQAVRRYTA